MSYVGYNSNQTWVTNGATTYAVQYSQPATVIFNGPPQPVPPRTEVESLLAEVEGVCALAR